MIGVIGLNHKCATIEVRGLYALPPEDGTHYVKQLKENDIVKGAILLSTCNRLELYYESIDDKLDVGAMLIDRLERYNQVDTSYSHQFYHLQATDAYQHLFRLASGLDSMVMGETQILGQLKDAYRMANEHNLSTTVLARLFHKAFETAKKIRTEHLVSATPLSAGLAAVRFMNQQVDNPQAPTLIIGAGQMAETVVQELKANQITDISIYNRTRERAERFAEQLDLECYFEDQMSLAISQANNIYVATSSLTPVITTESMPQQSDEHIYLFDMSVPRNVEVNVGRLKHATLYNIDDLKDNSFDDYTEQSFEEMQSVIQEKVDEFIAWADGSEMRHVISNIQEACNTLLDKELGNFSAQLNNDERDLLEHQTLHFKTTIATALTRALKEVTNDGQSMKNTEKVNALFKSIIKNN